MDIPVEVYSMGCVFLVIGCFGSAGGVVSGLLVRRREDNGSGMVTDVDSAIPLSKRPLANGLAGAVGAFAFVPFGARILDLQFGPLFTLGRSEETLKNTLFLISLSAIGGFAGYRMLTSLANKLLAKLEERTENLDARTKSLEVSNAQLEATTQSLEESNSVLEMKLLEAQADLNVAEQRFQEALALLEKFFSHADKRQLPVEVVVRAYNTKGRALKRVGRIDDALETVNRGLALKNIPPTSHANLLFNKSCYKSLLLGRRASEDDAKPLVALLRSCHALVPLKRQEIDADNDFENIRATNALSEFLKELS